MGGTGASVPVRLVYRLRVPSGVHAVPLSALEMGDTRLEPVQARLDGSAPRTVAWEPGDGPARRGRLALPGDLAGDSLRLELSYRVRAAVEDRDGDLRARLPVVQVAWPPEEALPGTFRARAILPDTLHVTGTFPTVLGDLRRGADGGERAYAFDLQVVPGVVVVEMTAGEAPLLTFARGLDAAVLLLLAVLGVAGWRALRRGAA